MRPVLVCLADRGGRLDADWLAGLQRDWPAEDCFARAALAARHGLRALPSADSLKAALAALPRSDRERGVLVLKSGLEPPRHWLSRLALLQSSPTAQDLAIFPGNYDDRVNPLAGLALPAKEVDIDSLVAAVAEARWSALADAPEQALYLRPGAPDRPSDWSVALVDDGFVIDPARPLAAASERRHPGQLALAELRLRLKALLDEGLTRLPWIGHDGRPVTLHISHSWGGGIKRWIEDQYRHDAEAHHLVLAAVAERDSCEYGEALALYGAGPGRGLLRVCPLSPAIADSSVGHPHYAEVLSGLLARYGVGRVIVSSLIGHALDCLRSGLPTAQMLHDFYPASPLLDRDPLLWQRSGRGLDLDALMADAGPDFLFRHREPAHWQRIRSAWLEAVHAHDVRLLAPTRHVAERWQALFEPPPPAPVVVPHGLPSAKHTPPIQARERADGRLQLVVIGRLTEGKGLGLLAQALPRLADVARVSLLGAGKTAERLFGKPGVDVILDYRPDELPALLAKLAPHAALFLSTVPETWSYALSEARALGLPVIATRLGAFAERIEHGVDGWLFEPDAEALAEAVRHLAEDGRALLPRLRAPADADPSLAETLRRYAELLPAEPAQPRVAAGRADAVATLRPALWQLVSEQARLEGVTAAHRRLELELGRRADWAQRMSRLAEARTAWAQSLEQELERAVSNFQQAEQRRLQVEAERLALERELAASVDREASLGIALDSAEAERQATTALLEQVRASWSWRLTLPLRLSLRLLIRLRAERVWNPLRWPGLARQLSISLRTAGLAGSLQAVYQQPRPDAAPTVAEAVDAEALQAAAAEAELRLAPADAPADAPASTALLTAADGRSVADKPAAVGLPDPGAVRPVRLAATSSPRVSIVVPVFNKVELTAACLHSLASTPSVLSYELIVVDDCSSDGTADFLARCQGVRVCRNEQNAGFIDSCNRGAALARGRYLVFLNNDTTVSAGWLEALIDPLESDATIGIVGGKLIYPDGRLQEAGGIIFADGSGWNYGRDDDPERPQYRFLSEADYVSGACLALARTDFDRLGGFDTHFRPAYYEDTDLCFRMRALGKRVVYQPRCVVVHHEGATSGTDENAGTKRYQAVNRDKFFERWAEVLAAHPPNAPAFELSDPVRLQRFHRKPRRALVIDATVPQPDHDSGSVRCFALLTLLDELGYLVSFLPQNLQPLGAYGEALERAGIELLAAPALGDPEAWLADNGPALDLVIVSRHYVLSPLMDMLRRLAPRALLVFDTVDLHFLREEREAVLAANAAAAAAAAQTRADELALIARSDVTLVVSPVEQTLLGQLMPAADVRVLSNIHQVQGSARGWAERAGLMFVGGFQHVPNVDAAWWLLNEIMPRIRARLPDVTLHLIGSRMPEALRRHRQPGVRVHGFVADLNPFLNGCRLSLAPLRYGAGVKGKVNQAMSHGLPVVATACAAEGMFLKSGRDVLVADQAAAFAEAVVRAYQDQALWEQLSAAGLDNVSRYFSRDAARDALQGLADRLPQPLPPRLPPLPAADDALASGGEHRIDRPVEPN